MPVQRGQYQTPGKIHLCGCRGKLDSTQSRTREKHCTARFSGDGETRPATEARHPADCAHA